MEPDAEFARRFTNAAITLTRARQLLAATMQLSVEVQRHCRDLTKARLRLRETRAEVRASLGLRTLSDTGLANPTACTPDRLGRILATAGLDESDLEDLTESLIAAHEAAVAREDDAMRTAVGDALLLIGRHLAVRLGPRAAGVVLS